MTSSHSLPYQNTGDFSLLVWQLLLGVLGVPLAAPDDELLSLGAVDTVAGSQNHLLGKERGSTQIDVNLLVLS